MRPTGLFVLLLLLLLFTACGDESRPGPAEPTSDATAATTNLQAEPDLPCDTCTINSDADRDAISDILEKRLALDYRPYRDHDGSEPIYPMGLTQFMQDGGKVCKRGGSCYTVASLSAVHSLLKSNSTIGRSTSWYYDPTYHINFGTDIETDANNSSIYYDAQPVKGSSDVILTYWYFYGFNANLEGPNPFCSLFDHEGDWEHVELQVPRNGVDKPRRYHYHEHNAVQKFSTDPSRFNASIAGWHPWIWVQAGGHAMDRFPEEGGCSGPAKGRIANWNEFDNVAHPLVNLSNHSDSVNRLEREVIQMFRGQYGSDTGSGASPYGPLQNDNGGRDYTKETECPGPNCGRPPLS